MTAADDADDLVIRAALGEPLSAAEQRRLDADPRLREEVAGFAEIVDLARTDPDALAPPGGLDHLWSGIAAEALGEPTATGAVASPTSRGDDADPERVPARSRAPLWAGLGVAAAVATAVAVTVGPLAPEPSPQPVAATDLRPVDGADAVPVRGSFVLADGTPLLRIDLSRLPVPPDGFYEVWLLDPERGAMVSLGPARPDGTYALPVGTAVDDFPAVDVSIEPRDGDPGHSGASVLRGRVRV